VKLGASQPHPSLFNCCAVEEIVRCAGSCWEFCSNARVPAFQGLRRNQCDRSDCEASQTAQGPALSIGLSRPRQDAHSISDDLLPEFETMFFFLLCVISQRSLRLGGEYGHKGLTAETPKSQRKRRERVKIKSQPRNSKVDKHSIKRAPFILSPNTNVTARLVPVRMPGHPNTSINSSDKLQLTIDNATGRIH
jgi:hypothetical protein